LAGDGWRFLAIFYYFGWNSKLKIERRRIADFSQFLWMGLGAGAVAHSRAKHLDAALAGRIPSQLLTAHPLSEDHIVRLVLLHVSGRCLFCSGSAGQPSPQHIRWRLSGRV